MRWPPGVRNEQHGPWGISKLCCRSQPRAASATKAAPRSATRYTRIGRSPSTWSANSTSGGPSVNWTAATRVPIASTANTTRPPKTSLKYPRSPATSLLGVYTKSSCWNGVGWSVTAARTGQRVPAERLILSCAEPNDLGDPHLDVANVCGCVHGDLPCSPARRSSSPRLLRRAAPYPEDPAWAFVLSYC